MENEFTHQEPEQEQKVAPEELPNWAQPVTSPETNEQATEDSGTSTPPTEVDSTETEGEQEPQEPARARRATGATGEA